MSRVKAQGLKSHPQRAGPCSLPSWEHEGGMGGMCCFGTSLPDFPPAGEVEGPSWLMQHPPNQVLL